MLVLVLGCLIVILVFYLSSKNTAEKKANEIDNEYLNQYYDLKMEDNYEKNKKLLRELLLSAVKHCISKIRQHSAILCSATSLYKDNLLSDEYYKKIEKQAEVLQEEMALIDGESMLYDGLNEQISKNVIIHRNFDFKKESSDNIIIDRQKYLKMKKALRQK